MDRVVEGLPLDEDALGLELALLGLEAAVVAEDVHGLRAARRRSQVRDREGDGRGSPGGRRREGTHPLALVPGLPLVIVERLEAVDLGVGQVGAADEDGPREAAGGRDVGGRARVDAGVGLALKEDDLEHGVLLEEVVDRLLEEVGGVEELERRVAAAPEREERVVEDELEEGVAVEDEELLTGVDEDVHPPRVLRDEPCPARARQRGGRRRRGVVSDES